MNAFIIIGAVLLTAGSTVCLGETQASPPPQMGFCFDEGTCVGGLDIQLQPSEPEPKLKRGEALEKCLLKNANDFLTIARDSVGVKLDSVFAAEELALVVCNEQKLAEKDYLSPREINDVRVRVQRQLIFHWLESRGA